MMNQLQINRLCRSVTLALLACCSASLARGVEVLIPSYFYPAGAGNGWPQLNTAAAQVALTAILNPNSGPGATVDPNYTNAVNSLRNSGGRVIGYVSTVYATRPAAQVKADILKYKNLYAIDGIFLDEMTNSNLGSDLNYYADIYGYIKSLNADYRVVGNPGTNTQPAYITTPTTDTVVSFESDVGYASWTPSTWTANFATRRFSNLPYNIATEVAMQSAVNAAASKRVGYVYVTDDNGANPWDRLPTYWNAELAAIRTVTPTWASSASGDWNQAANWTTPAAPTGVGAEATLLGAIASPQTIYTNSPITLGTLVLGNANRYVITGAGQLTMDASVESALIDVRKGDHTINLPLVLQDTTRVFVQGGASLTIADPTTILPGAALVKQGGGTLNLISIVNDAPAALAIQGGRVVLGETTRIGSLVINGQASLDLGESSLRIDSAQPEVIRAMLAAAAGSNEMAGITSSAVDGQHALAYFDVDAGVDIHLALRGDADGNGAVNFQDLLALARQFGTSQVNWAGGDFNYDGLADARDLSLLARNYSDADHSQNLAVDWELARSIVPEPTIAWAVALLVLRRSRRAERSI